MDARSSQSCRQLKGGMHRAGMDEHGDEFDEDGARVMSQKVVQGILRRNNGSYVTPQFNTTLYLNSMRFGSIQGLEAYTQCRVLHLESNCIKKIQGLEHMTQLRALYLQSNDLHRLEGLQSCTQLDYLDISSNPVQTLDGLPSSLSTLHASSIGLSDASMISKLAEMCPGLQVLDLSRNRLSASALPALCTLHKLRVLYCKENPCTQAANSRRVLVSSLPELSYLDERPIEEMERRGAEAWTLGGTVAEQAARQAWREERRRALKRTTTTFALERAHRRVLRELSGVVGSDEQLSWLLQMLEGPMQRDSIQALVTRLLGEAPPVTVLPESLNLLPTGQYRSSGAVAAAGAGAAAAGQPHRETTDAGLAEVPVGVPPGLVSSLEDAGNGLGQELQADSMTQHPAATMGHPSERQCLGDKLAVPVEECVVCSEELEEGACVMWLPCSHVFHERCIRQWLTGFSNTCPTCRAHVVAAQPLLASDAAPAAPAAAAAAAAAGGGSSLSSPGDRPEGGGALAAHDVPAVASHGDSEALLLPGSNVAAEGLQPGAMPTHGHDAAVLHLQSMLAASLGRVPAVTPASAPDAAAAAAPLMPIPLTTNRIALSILAELTTSLALPTPPSTPSSDGPPCMTSSIHRLSTGGSRPAALAGEAAGSGRQTLGHEQAAILESSSQELLHRSSVAAGMVDRDNSSQPSGAAAGKSQISRPDERSAVDAAPVAWGSGHIGSESGSGSGGDLKAEAGCAAASSMEDPVYQQLQQMYRQNFGQKSKAAEALLGGWQAIKARRMREQPAQGGGRGKHDAAAAQGGCQGEHDAAAVQGDGQGEHDAAAGQLHGHTSAQVQPTDICTIPQNAATYDPQSAGRGSPSKAAVCLDAGDSRSNGAPDMNATGNALQMDSSKQQVKSVADVQVACSIPGGSSRQAAAGSLAATAKPACPPQPCVSTAHAAASIPQAVTGAILVDSPVQAVMRAVSHVMRERQAAQQAAGSTTTMVNSSSSNGSGSRVASVGADSSSMLSASNAAPLPLRKQAKSALKLACDVELHTDERQDGQDDADLWGVSAVKPAGVPYL